MQMSPTSAALLSLAILACAVSLIWLVPYVEDRLTAYSYRREARRFQREPRVGDKAGYPTSMTYGGNFVVGTVVRATPTASPFRTLVLLETKFNTAMGVDVRQHELEVGSLRWFPPNTPLGINHVKQVKGDQHA